MTADEIYQRSVQIIGELKRFTEDDLKGKNRKHDYCVCRQIIWLNMFNGAHCPYRIIGEYFNRNHATVIHGIRKAEEWLQSPGWQQEQELYDNYFERLWQDVK